jgi:hypothetical protein
MSSLAGRAGMMGFATLALASFLGASAFVSAQAARLEHSSSCNDSSG